MQKYSKKAVISGKIVEFYEYGNLHISDYSVSPEVAKMRALHRGIMSKRSEKKYRRKQSNYRACKNIRGLVNSNAEELNKFVTLTFAKNEQDLTNANYEFKKFIQRLQLKIDYILKYVCIVEFQKRGAVHYHLIMNLSLFGKKRLEKIWGHGFVKINRINNVQNIGAYFSKHGTKGDDVETERLASRKKFFSSKNLKKPLEIKDDDEVNSLYFKIPDTSKILKSSEFVSFNGETIKYTQFKLLNNYEEYEL